MFPVYISWAPRYECGKNTFVLIYLQIVCKLGNLHTVFCPETATSKHLVVRLLVAERCCCLVVLYCTDWVDLAVVCRFKPTKYTIIHHTLQPKQTIKQWKSKLWMLQQLRFIPEGSQSVSDQICWCTLKFLWGQIDSFENCGISSICACFTHGS